MKGNPVVIAKLNELLASEHAAIQQYRTHAAMCENWGYRKLAVYLYERAYDEQEHAKELTDRILFLGGIPNLFEYGEYALGDNVFEMFAMDREAELIAVALYTEAVDVANEHKDYTTRVLMEHILGEEESHLNVIEENITQITNSGIENYLIVQVEV